MGNSRTACSSFIPGKSVLPGSGIYGVYYQNLLAVLFVACTFTGQFAAGAYAATTDQPKVGRYLLPERGLYVQFERRGAPVEFWNGQLIQQFEEFDEVLGHTVRDEVASQLQIIRDMGINRITFELRATDEDGDFSFPKCNLSPALGFRWPRPTAIELVNLAAFFDLVHEHGIRIWLRLTNTHMEEMPRTRSRQWLGAILNAVKDHPALDLVLFEGNTRHSFSNADQIDDSCGIPAEPPLWSGPKDKVALYVKWAIGYGMSLGMPARKLSAQAIVGDYFVDSETANPYMTDGHLWSPIVTLKWILDDLGIPDAQRTYAISYYQHSKCASAQGLPCTDASAHAWTDETLTRIFDVIGRKNGARVVAPELGVDLPLGTKVGKRTEWGLESLVFLMKKHGVNGGGFVRWVSGEDSEDTDESLPDPVKRRGVEYIFNPVHALVMDMGGYHLNQIPNGSFEKDADGNGVPDYWARLGRGTVKSRSLTPQVPSRGTKALRMVTGDGLSDNIRVRSKRLPVTTTRRYTTSAALRFNWSDDAAPDSPPKSRPQVYLAIRYWDATEKSLQSHPLDIFRYFQEDSTGGFRTFVVRYTPPDGAASASIEIGAARNGRTTPITLDVDYLR